MIGDGPLRDVLEAAVAERRLPVEFLGTRPHAELPALLNRSAAFVLPSLYEGNPKALVEAMACGVPAIGARVPGIQEIVRHRETGYLCGTSADEIRAAMTDVLAPPAEYDRLWRDAMSKTYPAVDRFEVECGAAIDPDWLHALARLTQIVIKRSELCYQHGRLLYAALSQYARRAPHEELTVIETGTARGFSALCMAKALDDTATPGTISTFDILPHDEAMFWNCVLDADGPRTRAQLLDGYADVTARRVRFHQGDAKAALAKVAAPRVHFAFLDSAHTYEQVMAEFAHLEARQARGDVLFFDDYTQSAYPGVVRAADEICATRGYAPVVVTANAARRYLIAEKR
jgi:predicted O-methyltransferase YrrM